MAAHHVLQIEEKLYRLLSTYQSAHMTAIDSGTMTGLVLLGLYHSSWNATEPSSSDSNLWPNTVIVSSIPHWLWAIRATQNPSKVSQSIRFPIEYLRAQAFDTWLFLHHTQTLKLWLTEFHDDSRPFTSADNVQIDGSTKVVDGRASDSATVGLHRRCRWLHILQAPSSRHCKDRDHALQRQPAVAAAAHRCASSDFVSPSTPVFDLSIPQNSHLIMKTRFKGTFSSCFSPNT